MTDQSLASAHAAAIRYHQQQVAKYEAEAIEAADVARVAFLDPDPKVFVTSAALADYANANLAAARRGLLTAEYAAA